MLGGWLSDRFFGKYNTVLWFSLIYCAGHAMLAAFDDNRAGFYSGLFLIALGSGGIKPLVVSFVGDQFDQSNKSLAKVVFDAFYWSINFGSFFASLLMPIFLREYGPAVAFGIPGILMGLATLLFWMGRNAVRARAADARQGPALVLTASRGRRFSRSADGQGRPGLAIAAFGLLLAVALLAAGRSSRAFWPTQFEFVITACLALGVLIVFGGIGTSLQLDRARGVHPDEAIEDVRAVLRILIVFGLVTPFWSLFDQKASTWVLQGNAMRVPHEAWWWPSWLVREPAQMQAVNPLLVMVLIPFNNVVVYPLLRRLGYEPTALRRMGWGIALSGLAWVGAGFIQLHIDSGELDVACVADPALRPADDRRDPGVGHRARIRLQPGDGRDEGRHHGVLVPVGHLRQPVGPADQRRRAERLGDGADRRHRLQRERVPDVLLRGVCAAAAVVFALYARSYPVQDNYRPA